VLLSNKGQKSWTLGNNIQFNIGWQKNSIKTKKETHFIM
jgi:hypothetical protein